MKLDQFMMDFWKENDEITVQCLWLQKLIKDENQCALKVHDLECKVRQLLNKIDGLEAKIELIDLLNVTSGRRLDERA